MHSIQLWCYGTLHIAQALWCLHKLIHCGWRGHTIIQTSYRLRICPLHPSHYLNPIHQSYFHWVHVHTCNCLSTSHDSQYNSTKATPFTYTWIQKVIGSHVHVSTNAHIAILLTLTIPSTQFFLSHLARKKVERRLWCSHRCDLWCCFHFELVLVNMYSQNEK